MGHYFPEITRMRSNVTFTRDGGVFVNFLLRGGEMNPYHPKSVQTLQRLHDQMFSALAELDTGDIFLGGFKARVRPEEVVGRVTHGIPNLSNDNYPALSKQLGAFRASLDYGEYEVFERVWWLSVKAPSTAGMVDRLQASVFEADPHEDVKADSVLRFREKVLSAIPPEFSPTPTTPAHLAWVFDRARWRGVPGAVPFLPTPGGTPVAQPGPKMFAEVDLNGAADTEAYYKRFLRDVKDFGLDANTSRAKDGFFANFRAARKGSIMSVTNTGTRTADFPGGIPSYQRIVGVSGYPTDLDYRISSFTAIVDQVDMDADYVIRISPAPDALTSDAMTRTAKNVDAEDRTVSTSEIMSADYADKRRELYSFYNDTRESPSGGLRVAVFFAFGDMDKDRLNTGMEALISEMSDHSFRLLSPVGGQVEMWKLMLPCSSLTSLARDFQQLTTARLFGGYAPLRRTTIGDPYGVPFAVNRENNLGQIVYLDLLTGTEQGNASIAFTGAQGSGKSHGMKLAVGWMSDMGRVCYILDQQGEWATFAEGLPSHAVVDMVNPSVSIDLFKVLPPDAAASTFVSIFCALLGVRAETAAGAYLRQVSQQAFREPRKLYTTRDVLRFVVDKKDFDAAEIIPGIKALLADPSTAALIDPMYNGKVVDLPAFDTNASIVVFLTKGLRNPTPGKTDLDMVERYTIAVNTVLARLTTYRFDRIAGACAFVGDEMSFLEGLEVLNDLVKTPDRTGRKVGNFVIAGSQTATEMGAGEYALIRRRFVMRQDNQVNAVGALTWADLPATSTMVDKLINETCPLDQNTKRPIPGREGEAYFFDGTRHARIKIMDQGTTERRVLSDTTSSRMIRRPGTAVEA